MTHKARQRKAPKPKRLKLDDPNRCTALDPGGNGWPCTGEHKGKGGHRFLAGPMPAFPPMGPKEHCDCGRPAGHTQPCLKAELHG